MNIVTQNAHINLFAAGNCKLCRRMRTHVTASVDDYRPTSREAAHIDCACAANSIVPTVGIRGGNRTMDNPPDNNPPQKRLGQ